MRLRKPKPTKRKAQIKIVERFKAELLGELNLSRPADLEAYWKQVRWPRPNLVELARNRSSPLAAALNALDPEMLDQASAQLDPFRWLLEAIDVREWSEYCRRHRIPWATRVWLAAASQFRAERSLIHKAHGWADAWEELRRNEGDPGRLRHADEFFFAQLRHSNSQRKAELLASPGLAKRIEKARRERDGAFLRRMRRAKQGAGQRAGVSVLEKFVVQHWLELPMGLPGFCFFSDLALDSVLNSFGLIHGDDWATKQTRVRLGLIQAGAKRHLIEEVIDSNRELRFSGSMVKEPWTFAGKILWGTRHLWPGR